MSEETRASGRERLRREASRVLGDVIKACGGTVPASAGLVDCARELVRLRATPGIAQLASRLRTGEEPVIRLLEAAQDAGRRSGVNATSQEADEELALVRLLACAELLGFTVDPSITGAAPADTLDDEAVARRVRAVELVVRGLIAESYRTQDALLARLRSLYKPEMVDRWLKAAQSGDALSGMSFGELSTFLVGKQEFPRYAGVFEAGEFLRFFSDRRKTLREYLDGLRIVRNALAHHRALSALQRSLVARYYAEVVTPVETAYQRGDTTVDPAAFLDTSREDVQRYVDTLKEDLQSVALDVEELRSAVARASARINALEGVLVLLVAAGAWFLLAIVVSTVEVAVVAGFSGGPPNLARVEEVSDRSIRGLGIAALTFVLAMARMGLNFALNRGWSSGLAARLTPARWRAVVVGWSLLGLAVYVPTGSSVSRLFTRAVVGDNATASLALLQLDEQGVRDALDRGMDPNAPPQAGLKSPLGIAAIGSALGPNYQPLPVAEAEARRLRIVELLLSRGARPTQDDIDQFKLLGRHACVEALARASGRPVAP